MAAHLTRPRVVVLFVGTVVVIVLAALAAIGAVRAVRYGMPAVLLSGALALLVILQRWNALAAAALSASEQHLTTTLMSIGDGVIATDATGCVTMMNRAAEMLTG